MVLLLSYQHNFLPMQRHLHALRQKPEHIRKSIAVGASFGITGLVALVWVGTLASTGAFALAPLGATNTQVATETTQSASPFSNFSQLLGGAAASGGTDSSSSNPALKIVSDASSSSLDRTQQPAQKSNTATVLTF
jgi:hypothetical protein